MKIHYVDGSDTLSKDEFGGWFVEAYVYYVDDGYEGWGHVIGVTAEGKIFETSLSHCSCYSPSELLPGDELVLSDNIHDNRGDDAFDKVYKLFEEKALNSNFLKTIQKMTQFASDIRTIAEDQNLGLSVEVKGGEIRIFEESNDSA